MCKRFSQIHMISIVMILNCALKTRAVIRGISTFYVIYLSLMFGYFCCSQSPRPFLYLMRCVTGPAVATTHTACGVLTLNAWHLTEVSVQWWHLTHLNASIQVLLLVFVGFFKWYPAQLKKRHRASLNQLCKPDINCVPILIFP